jgi:hypothetical protein
MYLKGFIYPKDGVSNKRSVHLTREPHYFTTSEIEGKMAVLFNTISSGALVVDKFEVEVITCETDDMDR